MVISKENKEKLKSILGEKWDNANCNICGGDLEISDTVFELSEFKEEGFKTVIPVMNLTCCKCGNTILINPEKLGLLK